MYILKVKHCGECKISRHRGRAGVEKKLLRYLREIGPDDMRGLKEFNFTVAPSEDPLDIIATGFFSIEDDELHYYSAKGVEGF